MPRVIEEAPQKIYLQIGDEPEDFDGPWPTDAAISGDVTWSAEPVLVCEVPYVRADIAALEQELAYGAARADIECHCPVKQIGGHLWYEVASLRDGSDEEDAEWVARAMRYLELRGLIAKHPDRPGFVRPLEAPNDSLSGVATAGDEHGK